MNVIVGVFYLECNTFNTNLTHKEDFVFAQGEEVLKRIYVQDIFEEAGLTVVPTISAVTLPAGPIAQDDYWYFTNQILEVVRNTPDLGGVWLHLHGSMEVENLGSGDLRLVKEIRKIVGPSIPIGIALDAHANNDEHLNEYVNAIRGYRTIPHSDQPETEREVARAVVNMIKEKQCVKPALITLPILISGEKGLAAAEPLKSLFAELDECEKDNRIAVSAVFMGDPWSDCPNSHLSVTVTPSREEYTAYAQEVCEKLAQQVMSVKEKFDFEVPTLKPQQALDMALNYNEKPVFVSDSGDNTTGGAVGEGTEVLRLVLEQKDLKGKKILVTAIHDDNAYSQCKDQKIGDKVDVWVGMNRDKISAPVKVEGVLKAKGKAIGYLLCGEDDECGECVTIAVGDIDIVISNTATSFITLAHFSAARLNWKDYDIIVLKQGYLFAELREVAKLAILAVTPGATYQYIEELDYKRVKRPIFPLD